MALTRRTFLLRSGGLLAGLSGLYALPELLRVRGLDSVAHAFEPDVVLDTFNGLAAMCWPGDDEYSLAQGESATRPGAVAANAGRHTIAVLDRVVPQPEVPLPNDETTPISGAVANLINSVAMTVNPAAAGGAFLSPFARLEFAGKVETYRRLESDMRGTPVEGAIGILPSLVLLVAFSEMDVLDPETRTLTRRPIGWDHGNYQGDRLVPVEGWDEFKGYYQNRREAGP